eukprot:8236040-Pyramimonas_sp.AAC.1
MFELYLGMSIRFAPRRVRAENSISEVIIPWRGILAGCNQSVDGARVGLFEMLQDLHDSFRPLQLDTWADDCSQRVVGHSRE